MRISDWSSDVCSSDLDCELHVRTACFHADFTQHRDARVAHDLIFLVGQRQRGRDGDGIAGMDAHRVDIFDGTDDDGIVVRSEEHTSELQSLMRISYAAFCLKTKHIHNEHQPTYDTH